MKPIAYQVTTLELRNYEVRYIVYASNPEEARDKTDNGDWESLEKKLDEVVNVQHVSVKPAAFIREEEE